MIYEFNNIYVEIYNENNYILSTPSSYSLNKSIVRKKLSSYIQKVSKILFETFLIKYE